MAFTADAIIANIESRLGDNGAHVWDFYKLAKGTFWCAGEVCYTFNKTGNKKKIFDGKAVFYVPTAQAWMAKHWKTVYDYRKGGDLTKVKKGDVVIFMWTTGSRDHIGFARTTGKDGELRTIEGNTSGGIVAKRTRAKKYIYAVYRPPYKSSKPKKPTGKYSGTIPKPTLQKGDKGTQVRYIQMFLNWYLAGTTKLVVDGSFGPATYSALRTFQSVEGIQVDGSYGKQSAARAKMYKAA